MGVDTFAEADVYAGARVFTGWNLARPGERPGAALRLQLQRRAARHHRQGVHVSNLPGRQQNHSRASRAGRRARRPRSHRRTRARIRQPDRAWPRKLYAFFVNEVDPPDTALLAELAAVYYARNYEIEPMVRADSALAAVSRSVQLLQALRLACRIRGACAEGGRVDRVFGQRRAHAAREHGAAAARAAGRERLGPGAELVLDRGDARADEFRGAARDESEVQAARRVPRPGGATPDALRLGDARQRSRRRVRRAARAALTDYLQAGGAWGAPTRSWWPRAPGSCT